MMRLRRWLAHPLTRGMSLDDPLITHLRRRIIREKAFLRLIYLEWYRSITSLLPSIDGAVLELGSGAGFFEELLPGLITSEVFQCPYVRVILDGQALPFAGSSLRAIVMTDVLHHLPAARQFFTEAARCVRPGGVLVMIEPWVTAWSRWVYPQLHHEPFKPGSADWGFPSSGPLSGANDALPWIIFERDRAQFEHEFPQWKICRVEPQMPFRYLVSGGMSMRDLMPAWSFGLWRGIENALRPWMRTWGMFALIALERVGGRE
jgi:SAM-dependent methyltransferase